jgi:glycosyltransferase involved in cell wall biosynthesis
LSAWPIPTEPVVAPGALPPQPAPAKVKVLHVITRFWAGAGGNTLLSAAGMDPDRYEVWVAGCPGGPLWARAEAAGVRTVQVPRFKETLSPLDDLSVLVQLVRLIRAERFTVVHTHSAKGGFLGRLAAWLCRVPLIVHTFHGFSFHDFMSPLLRRAYLALERMGRPLTDGFLAVSPRVAREAVETRLAGPGRVAVAPSAVELDEIPSRPDPAVRAELGIPASVPVVGTVGRIDHQKAPLDFVRMAAAVARQRPDARFVMVGAGPLEDEVRAEAARLGVEVLLTGYRSDAPRVGASFDVFVISSLYEGLGRALTEALASGRPVVATAVNGVPDLVVPGATGLLAPARDPDALARSVAWLLDHPEEGRRMGTRGRAAVLAVFAPERMCHLIDQAYCRALGLPAPPPPTVDLTRAGAPAVAEADLALARPEPEVELSA